MLIVILGINIIFFKNNKWNTVIPEEVKTNKASLEQYNALFSGTDRIYRNEKFSGADLSAVFGGIKLDLSSAIIENDVRINGFALFAGCEITVPKNVNVNASGSNVFGGVSNKVGFQNENFPTIYLVSQTLFGGISIK